MKSRKCGPDCQCHRHDVRPIWNKGLTKETHPALAVISRALMGRSPGNKGKKGNPAWNKGLATPPDIVKKQHAARIGTHHSLEHRAKISMGNKGKIVSLETRKKMSDAWKNPGPVEKRAATWLKNYGRPDGPRRDTRIEQKVAVWLDAKKINYLHPHPMYGTLADFYIPEKKIVIEADGCYWHNCSKCYPNETPNPKNKIRDNVINQRLGAAGYTVIRLRECELDLKLKDETLLCQAAPS